MSGTADGKQALALRLSMIKLKGKSQVQKARSTVKTQNFKTSTSKREKHVGFAYCLL